MLGLPTMCLTDPEKAGSQQNVSSRVEDSQPKSSHEGVGAHQ